MIGFWLSLLFFIISSIFAIEQFTKFFLQRKSCLLIEDQIVIHQKKFNRYQYFRYSSSGSFSKNLDSTKKSERHLLNYPVSLLMYLQPESIDEKKEIEFIFDKLYFSKEVEMKKEFFKLLQILYQKNPSITMQDIIKMRFENKEYQQSFGKMIRGKGEIPPFLTLFGIGTKHGIYVYHCPQAILELYFSPLEIKEIVKNREDYKKRINSKGSKNSMEKLIETKQKGTLFSAKLLYHEKNMYFSIKHNEKKYMTLLQ